MQAFKLSAHKFHSPDYKRWRHKWTFDQVFIGTCLEVQERPTKFGEVEVTVGYENSDPDEVRQALNEISWRTKDDFSRRGCYA